MQHWHSKLVTRHSVSSSSAAELCLWTASLGSRTFQFLQAAAVINNTVAEESRISPQVCEEDFASTFSCGFLSCLDSCDSFWSHKIEMSINKSRLPPKNKNKNKNNNKKGGIKTATQQSLWAVWICNILLSLSSPLLHLENTTLQQWCICAAQS